MSLFGNNNPVPCRAGERTVLVRNIAARGLSRTFFLSFSGGATGKVEVRRSVLPFFLLSARSEEPLVAAMEVKRGFFDASFELVVTPEQDLEVFLR